MIRSLNAVGSSADNAAMAGFLGLLNRERINSRKYRNRA
jgi:hypothetical protein